MSAGAGAAGDARGMDTTMERASDSTPPGPVNEPATTPNDSIAMTAREAIRGVGSWLPNGGRGSGGGGSFSITGVGGTLITRISRRVDSTGAGSGPRRVPQLTQ